MVQVAAIPAKYKNELGVFVGDTIEVAVKLKGMTRSGKTSNAFDPQTLGAA